MNKIYIRFAGDSDYSNTVMHFVKAIAPRILLDNWSNITKEEIVNLFNNHAYSLYCLHQSPNFNPRSTIKDYLKISVEDVYFDDEFLSFTDYNHDGCLAYIGHFNIIYEIV